MARQMKDSGIEWIGEIPQEWNLRRLRFLCDITTGNQDTQDNDPDGEYPFYVRSPIVERSRRYTFEGPAILMAGDGVGAGKVFHDVDGKYGCHQRVYSMQHIRDVYRRFLFYYLQNRFFISIETANSKSTVDSVRLPMLQDFPVTMPSFEEQKAIADFLDRKCAEIDAVIERTKATIEEYKKLKQAVITEAVTKGMCGERKMKDSGIEWIGEIPEEWIIRKGKWILELLERPVQADDGVITCFRDGEVTLRSKRREDGFTFSLQEVGYQGIEPGDLVVHGMDGFAGAIGISDSRGKGTPVLNVLDSSQNKKYVMYYLRNMAYNGIFLALATGIRVRSCDTNWNKLKELPYLIPPLAEQEEIVNHIDRALRKFDTLIAKKTVLLTELETYKKSLIYEYVTGKKECPEIVQQAAEVVVYPLYPATLNTKKIRFAQAMLMAKILDVHGKGMGRVKLEKMLYTIETSIGFDFDTEYVREAAGPLHESIYKCEGIISRQNHWYQLHQSQYGVSYTPTKDARKYKAYYDKYFSAYNAEIERIIGIFKPYNTDQAEVVATLFAAWNDAVIAGKPYTDEDVVDDVLNNWHESKKRYPKDMWLRAMAQMRKDKLVPKGYGKKTRH